MKHYATDWSTCILFFFFFIKNLYGRKRILIEPNLYVSCLSLKVNGFRSYVDLYVKDKLDETGVALKVVNETVNDRWEVCLTMSEKGFQQISFVNSIATTKVSNYKQWKTDWTFVLFASMSHTTSNTEAMHVPGWQTHWLCGGPDSGQAYWSGEEEEQGRSVSQTLPGGDTNDY